MNNGSGGGRCGATRRGCSIDHRHVTTGLLAAYITLANHIIYTHYEALKPGERSPLADQQLGGAYMLVVGTIAIVAALLLTLRDPDRRE